MGAIAQRTLSRMRRIFFGTVLLVACAVTIYFIATMENSLEDNILWYTEKGDDFIDDPILKVDSNVLSDYWHPYCGFIGDFPISVSPDVHKNSTCSLKATLRGENQKVVSFSFYGDVSNSYFKGIETHAKKVDQLYPGWLMRIYHNIYPSDFEGMNKLCDIVRKYSNLDDCFVGDLPNMGSVEKTFGAIWRFAVMADPLVDLFAVRDLDSSMLQREADAVNDWMLNTNATWHFMRDHRLHNTPILAGMWGARNRDLNLMLEIREKMFSSPEPHVEILDQLLLDSHVWIHTEGDRVSHDSFYCQVYPEGWRPFPSQRHNFTFVGGFEGVQDTTECPAQCRPKDHFDWTYC